MAYKGRNVKKRLTNVRSRTRAVNQRRKSSPRFKGGKFDKKIEDLVDRGRKMDNGGFRSDNVNWDTMGSFKAATSDLAKVARAARTRTHKYAAQIADDAMAYMKANAPWTDRTTDARNLLSAWVEYGDEEVQINLAHGVQYGYYLEIKPEFAIVGPTAEMYARILESGNW